MFTVNGEKLSPTSFPDKTCSLRLYARDDAYKIDWKYDGDHECMLLWNLVHHIRANNGENTPIGLYMPYVPNARMDRVKTAMRFSPSNGLRSLSTACISPMSKYLIPILMSLRL